MCWCLCAAHCDSPRKEVVAHFGFKFIKTTFTKGKNIRNRRKDWKIKVFCVCLHRKGI